jgi:hypothetical protein
MTVKKLTIGVIVVCIIILAGVLFGCVPEQAMAKTTKDVALAMSGDSLQVTVYYNLHGQADSVKYVVGSTNGKAPLTKVGKSASGQLVFMLFGPAEGETDTVTVSPTAYKAGQAFVQTPIKKVFTRSVTAPPVVTDSVTVSQAIMQSKLVDTALIALTTGEMCKAEIRDYHRGMLIVPRGAQSSPCGVVFNTEIARDNERVITALNAGYPWTVRQDSIWLAEPPSVVEYPKVFMSVAYHPSITVDTFVYAGGNENGIEIAQYRVNHPNFTWP